jgi:phosphoethanolamine N-methyltransferase
LRNALANGEHPLESAPAHPLVTWRTLPAVIDLRPAPTAATLRPKGELDMVQYPDDFVDQLHLIWGEGFLSPGGEEEALEIVCGIELAGKRILDIGCGTGGPAITLSRVTGALVTGIDIEAQLVARASRLAEKLGISGRVRFQAVEIGRLPFEDQSFDLVFSKDALIHVADKVQIYREIGRVLRPGGTFAASDWLCGEDAASDPAFAAFLDDVHLNFAMATAEQTRKLIHEAGFTDIVLLDRNAWYTRVSAEECAALEGPLRCRMIEKHGASLYDAWCASWRKTEAVAKSGSLRPTHIRAIWSGHRV